MTTTYTYYDDATNNTGELETIDYSDATPDVDFDSYDRMGRLTQVTGAVGTRTFSFDANLNPDKVGKGTGTAGRDRSMNLKVGRAERKKGTGTAGMNR